MGKILVVVIALVILFAVLYLVDFIGGETKYIGSGFVVEKSYSPGKTTTGYGFGLGSNGQSSPIITQSREEEKYILFVSVNDEIMKAESGMDLYVRSKIGSSVKIFKRFGCITGAEWSCYAEKN